MNYLIPANAKRGQYILGIFRPIDLIIFGIGLFATIILVMIMPMDQTWGAVIAVAPVIVCALLVAPVAYYHNVRSFIGIFFKFITSRQKYVWKGWCYIDEVNKFKK